MKVNNVKTAFIEDALLNAGLPFSKGKPKQGTLNKLAAQGQRSHSKFLRQMMIAFNVKAPLYWWTEFDTYKIGITRMSESTMHTILDKKLTLQDFDGCGEWAWEKVIFNNIIEEIEKIKKTSVPEKTKIYAIKRLLPSSFLYSSFVTMNYECLRNIYKDRINHRLPEWKSFLRSFEDIPYFDDFILDNSQEIYKTKNINNVKSIEITKDDCFHDIINVIDCNEKLIYKYSIVHKWTPTKGMTYVLYQAKNYNWKFICGKENVSDCIKIVKDIHLDNYIQEE